jgi:AcrR family transcriptional regulator
MASGTVPDEQASSDLRSRVVAATAQLLASGGRDAVTTRAAALAAGTQAPTIYRLFGGKEGLLDAVAEYGFQAYMSRKALPPESVDPLQDLRAGWDLHIDFGMSNPSLYTLMYGDGRPFEATAARRSALRFLRERVERVASAGLLAVSTERATNLIQAAGTGTVMTLLTLTSPDPGLSSAAREAVIAAISTQGGLAHSESDSTVPAMALYAQRDLLQQLTVAERELLAEWLLRIAK